MTASGFEFPPEAHVNRTPTTPVDNTGLGPPPPAATDQPPPAMTAAPAPTVTPTPTKVTFGYSSMPLPAASLNVASIGGSSASDVWMVARASSATSAPWTAYHYDGTKWTSMAVSSDTTGRPNFGVVSLGGSNVYMGFSEAAEIFQLRGSSFTKIAGFSLTSGYSMAAVGSKVYVGTQENFGTCPLYILDGRAAQQADVPEGTGGVLGIWGSSENDVWLARSEGLGHITSGAYQDVDATPARAIDGTAKDDVWLTTDSGVRHFDGSKWSDVSFPSSGGTSDSPRSLAVLAKDEVVVTTYSKVYRYDGTGFVADTRASAPKTTTTVGRIGNEAWLVTSDAISRLAPAK